MTPRICLMIYAAAAAALLGPGCASNHRTGERTEPGGGQNYGHLTGSYVPQDVQRNGPVTNGKSNVRVIDRSDIERSGGADINQTLRELGANR